MSDPCFFMGCIPNDKGRCGECGRSVEKTWLGQAMDIINSNDPIKIKRALLRERLELSEKTIEELCPMNQVDY